MVGSSGYRVIAIDEPGIDTLAMANAGSKKKLHHADFITNHN